MEGFTCSAEFLNVREPLFVAKGACEELFDPFKLFRPFADEANLCELEGACEKLEGFTARSVGL